MSSGHENEQRSPVGVAHVVLETDRMDESAHFIKTFGPTASLLASPRSFVFCHRLPEVGLAFAGRNQGS